ncbi:MAG: hypothetical protein AUH78_14465 [Gemmatimonadetes bacterium 13_1_40CM_4_69_8]|nr:MAG: hypothetical protein AUH78_14465 [Gemmatimonadetes bacterium 13_1_40CM_4_69_8]
MTKPLIRLRALSAAGIMSTWRMSGRPSLLKSAISMPMPAKLVCLSQAAALSVNVPSPLLMYRTSLGATSLET